MLPLFSPTWMRYAAHHCKNCIQLRKRRIAENIIFQADLARNPCSPLDLPASVRTIAYKISLNWNKNCRSEKKMCSARMCLLMRARHHRAQKAYYPNEWSRWSHIFKSEFIYGFIISASSSPILCMHRYEPSRISALIDKNAVWNCLPHILQTHLFVHGEHIAPSSVQQEDIRLNKIFSIQPLLNQGGSLIKKVNQFLFHRLKNNGFLFFIVYRNASLRESE